MDKDEGEKDIAEEAVNKDCEEYANVGAAYLSSGNYGDAIKTFQQLLAVAIETNKTMYQKMAYLKMAKAHKKLKAIPPQAIDCYEEWLKLPSSTDDLEEKCKVYDKLGTAYQRLSNPSQAAKCYEKTAEIAKQIKNPKMEEKAYAFLGNSYLYLGKFIEAGDSYEKLLKLAIEMDDQFGEGAAYNNLASTYLNLNDYPKTVEYLEKALRIAETMRDREYEAIVYFHLGHVYQRQGDYHKAIEYHDRQLEILKQIGDKRGQAAGYGAMGVAYLSLGNYYEIIKNQTKNLEICIEIGFKFGEVRARANLGKANETLGQYREAIAHYKKSLEIARQIDERCSEGTVNGNLGSVYFTIGQYEEAFDYFSESLKIALEVKERSHEAAAYGNLGKCKTVLGLYDEALELFDKQIRLVEEMGNKALEASGYGNKGHVYIKLNSFQQAFDCFNKELKLANEMDSKKEEAISYGNFGKSYRSMALLNDKDGKQQKYQECIAKSIHFYRESVRCYEVLFDHLREQDQHKISILETFIEEYKILTELLLANKENKEALLISERGRARALDDLLVSKYSINRDNQSGSSAISYAAIENMSPNCSILFYSVHSTFHCSWIIGPSQPTVIVHATDQAGLSHTVQSAYDTLNVREVHCEDRSIQAGELQEIQNIYMPKKSNIVDESEKLLFSIYEKIKQRCIPYEDLYDDANLNPLEGLHKTLLSPVLHQLTEDEIIIIPDGDLYMVPFAALRDPNTGEVLSETKRIRLAPSLTSLKMLQESPANFHCTTGAMIIGNPLVGKVMFNGKRIEITDLPCAEREAEMIGELLNVKPFIGSQATKEAIRQTLREGVAIIHFAAHGTTDGEIFLAPSVTDDLPNEQDYILTMKDVQESGARPQLVVLSCCHSGRGEIKAEGVVGMSRAFLAAGARAVVASLWAIADEATMVFMEKFYTHLKQGESASKSLQAAMKDMREIPRYSDPQFWAPFFLIGDDVIIKMSPVLNECDYR